MYRRNEGSRRGPTGPDEPESEILDEGYGASGGVSLFREFSMNVTDEKHALMV